MIEYSKPSLSLDEYTVEPISDGLRVISPDAADITYGLGRYDYFIFYEGKTLAVSDYILEKDHIDLILEK